MKFTIACIQLNTGDNMDANIARIEALVGQAAGQGAQLAALPENAFLMQQPVGAGCAMRYAQDAHPGIIAAKALAKKYGIWILIGSAAVKTDESGKCANRSLLLNDKGEVAAHYDKIHLFDAQLPNGEHYAESDRMLHGLRLAIADTPWGKLGLTICYDVRFPHLFRALAKAGAQIIAVPSAFTYTTGEAHWHVLLRARAIENGCYIVAPAQCGMHPGNRKTYGHSLVVDPWGKIIAEAAQEEGVLMAELDMDLVAHTRAKLPSLSHDRDFC